MVDAAMGEKEARRRKKSSKSISFSSVFMHADGYDVALMGVGLLSGIGDGSSLPIMFTVISKMMNAFGNSAASSPENFTQSVNKSALIICYLACAKWVCCFLEGYCWTRTAERQASRLRISYLRAVMRQDVGYFDLHVTSTAEVIESISNDSLVIQQAISEKVPVFVMHVSNFFGSYIAGFIMLWRLAIVGFPFIVLLVIPGLVYGRALMSIARKMRDEYGKANVIVEQALSSVRTVYSFVGQSKTVSSYSAVLQGTMKLGMRQGLAKGLAIGSNGIVFAIWAFMSYYGSRLVMYHNAQGGTIFAVGNTIVIGGLSLGSALSNLRYFYDASAAAERVREVINRVPKIDSHNMEGQVLQNVCGEVEFRHVAFAYPSRPESMIFNDFNLKVPAGKRLALVGKSGSGKSTAVALLQRFYDQTGGDILIDGVAIDEMQLKWLRSQLGLVSQEPALFATSIKENILFGKED